MALLWSKKKKKVLAKKERFKIIEDIIDLSLQKDDINKFISDSDKTPQIEPELSRTLHGIQGQDLKHIFDTLQKSCLNFSEMKYWMKLKQAESREIFIQSEYPELKNVTRIVPWINQILSSWSSSDPPKSSLNYKSRFKTCLKLLTLIDIYIADDENKSKLSIWLDCKRAVRSELCLNIDYLSYQVLKNIESEMSVLNTNVMYSCKHSDFFKDCLWTPKEVVTNEGEEKFPLSCNFKECGITLKLPKTFSQQMFAVRCLLMAQDYFSESYVKPLPHTWKLSLHQYIKQLYDKNVTNINSTNNQTGELRKEFEQSSNTPYGMNSNIPFPTHATEKNPDRTNSIVIDDIKEPIKDCWSSRDLLLTSNNLAKEMSWSLLVMNDEREEMQDICEYYKVELREQECNARMYHVIGGVYSLNLLKRPPQPKLLRDGSTLRIIIGEDMLQFWDYQESYNPPEKQGPIKESTEDDEEENIDNTPEGSLLAKLVHVIIKLPDHVLWFDNPLAVLWNDNGNYWCHTHIYETKFNEEKQVLSFRTGKMGSFGLAVFKFNNLPFQSWELKPGNSESQVVFMLTSSILVLEFILAPSKISMTLLENANTPALQELVNIFFEPHVLVEKLKKGGVNIFPSDDAFMYIDGVQMKHRVTEDHLYYCMAKLCRHYQFSWSKWNLMAGYRKFVTQVRGTNTDKANNELLVITDQRAVIVDTIVDIQHFDDNALLNADVSPDLMALAEKNCGEEVLTNIGKTEEALVETVYYFLTQTKIMSYS